MANRVRDLLRNLQKLLDAELSASRAAHSHPGAKGDASEANWIGLLGRHLPARYAVTKGFVVDSKGAQSDQIDVIIYDRQYSALVFNRDDFPYVPAESVYAVFEAKQVLNKKHVGYAMTKAASVRRLHRTSVAIPHAGGQYKPRTPFPIAAGVLTLRSTWSPPFGASFVEAASTTRTRERLDLGCAVQSGAFELAFSTASPQVTSSQAELSLASFLLTLLARLQDCGTVPAIDYRAYLGSVAGSRRT